MIETVIKAGLLTAFLIIVGGLVFRLVQKGDHLDPTWAAVLGSLIAAISSFRSIQRRRRADKKEEEKNG